MNEFKVSYITTLPKEANAPSVSITGDEDKNYRVFFVDVETSKVVSSGVCKNNQTILSNSRQWYTNWLVVVDEGLGEIVHTDFFELENKTVFIKMDAHALGDNIAWMPYVRAFKKKHNCNVICSTFYNDLFVSDYPEILFVKPNTVVENIFTQYYVGASNDGNLKYSPVKVNEVPLQQVASRILGLETIELNPEIGGKIPMIHSKPYVTLSEFGSAKNKEWVFENGWQQVVDFLNSKGYDVVVISKEPTQLKNVIDLTGNIPLEKRAVDIKNAAMHLGVSSGLSWLAWGLGTHVVMISDVTPIWHEFQTNITRLCANELNQVDYEAKGVTSITDVLKRLDEMAT